MILLANVCCSHACRSSWSCIRYCDKGIMSLRRGYDSVGLRLPDVHLPLSCALVSGYWWCERYWWTSGLNRQGGKQRGVEIHDCGSSLIHLITFNSIVFYHGLAQFYSWFLAYLLSCWLCVKKVVCEQYNFLGIDSKTVFSFFSPFMMTLVNCVSVANHCNILRRTS